MSAAHDHSTQMAFELQHTSRKVEGCFMGKNEATCQQLRQYQQVTGKIAELILSVIQALSVI